MTTGSLGNRQASVYAAQYATFIPATIALCLRFVARWMKRNQVWWDDYFALMAWLTGPMWNTVMFVFLSNILGLHLKDIDVPEDVLIRQGKLFLWIQELYTGLSLGFVKFSLLAFYWRLFKTSGIRIPIQVVFAMSVVWTVTRSVIVIFHCVPVNAYWDLSVEGTCTIDDSKFLFGTILVHLVIDVIIIVLPVVEIQKLRLPQVQKWGIAAMFFSGILVCACSILVIYESWIFDMKSPDVSWDMAPVWAWGTAELNLATVSACLPVLRPILNLVTRRESRFYGVSNSYEQTSRNNQTVRMSSFHQRKASRESSYHQKKASRESNSTTRRVHIESPSAMSSEEEFNLSELQSGGNKNTQTVVTDWTRDSIMSQRNRERAVVDDEEAGDISSQDIGEAVTTNDLTVAVSPV